MWMKLFMLLSVRSGNLEGGDRISGHTLHQQKPEKLSAFLGFSQAFRLPKKLTSVPKTDNLLHRA